MAGDYKLPLAVTERVRFYDGQFLQDQDFIDEQKYHLARHNRHHRTLHVTGVAEGLTAYTPANTTFQVKVRPGLALDPDGRQILLTGISAALDLPANTAGSERWLYIAYHQVPDKLQSSGQGVEGETRWSETPYIFASDNPNLGVDDDYEGPDWSSYLAEGDGPPPPVLLAKLTIDAGGKVSVDNNVRHFAGVRLPGPDTLAPTLRADVAGKVGLWLVNGNDLSERLTISPEGNVGINTNAPTAPLEIGSTLKATRNGQTLVAFKIAPTFDAAGKTNVKNYGLLVESGYVGIGTTNVEKKLHIGSGELRVQASHNSTTADIGAFYANNLTQGIGIGYNRIEAIGSNPNQDILLLPKGTGKVGIGTTERSATLEVNGGALISGDLTVAATTLYVDSTNNRVGIGTAKQSASLEVSGAFKASSNSSGERKILMEAPSGGNHRGDNNTQNATGLVYRMKNPASGDPIFQVRSEGNAIRLFVEHDGWTGSKDNSAWFGGSRANYFAGNVGIGTTTPDGKLDIAATGDGTTVLKLTTERAWAFQQEGTRSGAALRLRNVRGPNKIFYIDTNGSTRWRNQDGTTTTMTIQQGDGKVGIGTTTPKAKLHVQGSGDTINSFTGDSNGGAWMHYESGSGEDEIDWAKDAAPLSDVSIYASGSIVADGRGIIVGSTVNWSDERSKSVIGQSNNKEDLELLSQIKITDYFRIKEGSREKKVIAQELRDVFPQAVSIMRGVVPTIFEHSDNFSFDQAKKELTITLSKAHNLDKGDLIDVYTDKAKLEETKVIAVPSNSSVVIECDYEPAKVMVYGKWVDDVHMVDYDAISMLNVSATQHLYQLVQAQQKKLEEQSRQNEQLEMRIVRLQEKVVSKNGATA